jgi:hypothetical protein
MIFECGSLQGDVDVLAACDVRTRTALDIAIATSFTPRFADVRTLPMLLTPRRSLKLGDLEANDTAPMLRRGSA